MTKTPRWLPDGSGIDPDSLGVGMVREVADGTLHFADSTRPRGPIVRVYADVTPPRPDARVEVVARAMSAKCGSDAWVAWEVWADDARTVLAALDAMGGQK